jgi:Phytanoyl-CoA dioxygenase (PhyH)
MVLYAINGIDSEEMSIKTSINGGSSSSSTTSSMIFKILRLFFLALPLYATFILLLAIHGLRIVYQGPLSKLLTSLQLVPDHQDENGLYLARDPEITYYNRQCHLDDISTRDANDLLIHDDHTRQQRKDVMMNHGAVVMKNILSHNTSAQLRDYLERRHDTFMENDMTLPWNELFWNGGDGSRLSLGIGPEDDPIIAQALHEVGHNTQLEETLTAILGPNPALVEVSTLTTMHGAKHQGIHTDSDYFGSSVLYARTFLHSYTMFVALQHTTAKLGATTLCPGTHLCANEDLSKVCMAPAPDGQRNSFEASSNGHTGLDRGALLEGDAMMFNQNVWHRGPRNKDPERPFNRAMFILTFISQRDFEKGDVRQQGWGTYYYMRHSMWGQAFHDLKNVLKGGMSLPVRFLKAYGLYSTPSSGNGHAMPWLEHWARQMANEMDFFTAAELNEFQEMLQASILPKKILGDHEKDDWGEYLAETMDNAVAWIDEIYLWVLFLYLVTHLVAYSLFAFTSKNDTANSSGDSRWIVAMEFLLQLVVGHFLLVGIFSIGFSSIMTQSPLFKRIGNGYIFRKPFTILDDTAVREHLQGRTTTVPDRMDVLIGSRFDTPYLASMNDMLDYHPGNKEWNRIIQDTAGFPLVDVASQVLVDQVTSIAKPLHGVPRRFLLQDHATGFWTVMSKAEAETEAKRALKMAEAPLIAELTSYWKEVLADSRFGLFRETAMGKVWTPKTVEAWMDDVLFPEKRMAKTTAIGSSRATTKSPFAPTSVKSKTPPKQLSFRNHLQKTKKDAITLKVGDIVLVKGTLEEDAYLAKILKIVSPKELVVRYVDSYSTRTLSIGDIQPHRPIEQGHRVLVPPMEGDEDEEWVSSQVLVMYPTGVAEVSFGGPDEEGKHKLVESLNVNEMYLEADGHQVPDFRLDWR